MQTARPFIRDVISDFCKIHKLSYYDNQIFHVFTVPILLDVNNYKIDKPFTFKYIIGEVTRNYTDASFKSKSERLAARKNAFDQDLFTVDFIKAFTKFINSFDHKDPDFNDTLITFVDLVTKQLTFHKDRFYTKTFFNKFWSVACEKIRFNRLAFEVNAQSGKYGYLSMFPVAKDMSRRYHLSLGPTNSGKTFDALEALKSAYSGIYLAPLRLLALEVYEKLNNSGIPCNLITGEQRIIYPGARHTASTIECLNFNETVDVAVIDECQMFVDESRGYAWTNAILGTPAKDIYLIGSPVIETPIVNLLKSFNLDNSMIINRKERFGALKIIENKVYSYENGDALIAFSRSGVLKLFKAMKKKYATSVIYGALPPENRRYQSEKFMADYQAFKSGVSKKPALLISTDAIGMGLNMPIDRIFFTETEKYNGKFVDNLNPMDILQIAGRAGRYSPDKHHLDGYVGCGFAAKMSVVKHGLTLRHDILAGPYTDHKFYVFPTYEQVKVISDVLKTEHIGSIFQFFYNDLIIDNHFLIKKEIHDIYNTYTDLIKLAEEIDEKGCYNPIKPTLHDYYNFVTAPASKDFEISYLLYLFQVFIMGDYTQFHNGNYVDLYDVEQASAELTIYATMAYKYPDRFNVDCIEPARSRLSNDIERLIRRI